jgi:hypothetical protein
MKMSSAKTRLAVSNSEARQGERTWRRSLSSFTRIAFDMK